MIDKEFNKIVKAVKEHDKAKAEKLILDNIDGMTDKQRKKITKEVKKHYDRM